MTKRVKALQPGPLAYALICVGVSLRLVPHPPNVAPIGAIALFGGSILPPAEGFIVPIAALAISDALLGFYQGMGWVYGAFLLVTVVGRVLLQHRTLPRLIAGSLIASVSFFLITNFGVWIGPLYPHTWGGLREDYLAAIPFFRNTVIGDLAYTFVLFGLYEMALRMSHALAGTRTVNGR